MKEQTHDQADGAAVPTEDTVASHLRNALQIIECELSESRVAHVIPALTGGALLDVKRRIEQALALAEAGR